MTALLLLAQAAPPPPADVPFLLRPEVFLFLMVLFFFTVLMPGQGRARREEEQRQAKLLAALKPGARVATTGGILGTVVSVKDGEDEITLRSADAKLKVLKSSVAKVLDDDPAEAKS